MRQHYVRILSCARAVLRWQTYGVFVAMILLCLTCSSLEDQIGCGVEPLYARHAAQSGEIKSPDGKGTVMVKTLRDRKDPDGYVSYRVTLGAKHFDARLSGWRTEVLWSPDSKAFAVNQTVGGGGIGQRTYVFYLEEIGLKRVDVSPPIEKVFGSPVKCEVPIRPNTATIKWLDSKRIVVVAEVVPVSICRCGGTFKAYEVSVPDLRILHVYGQAESKKVFSGALGCELRHADDSCAKSWQK